MNMNYSIKGLEMKQGNDFVLNLEGIDIQLTDLDLKEYVLVLKEIPALIREIKAIASESEYNQGFDAGKSSGYDEDMRLEKA